MNWRIEFLLVNLKDLCEHNSQEPNDYDVDWFDEPPIEQPFPVYAVTFKGISMDNCHVAEAILSHVFNGDRKKVDDVILGAWASDEYRMNVEHWEVADHIKGRFDEAISDHYDAQTLAATMSVDVRPNPFYCAIRVY